MFLSFLWPGAGNVYVGQVALGLIIMGVVLVLAFLSVGLSWIVGWSLIYFSYKAAMDLREGKPIHKWMKKIKPIGRTTR